MYGRKQISLVFVNGQITLSSIVSNDDDGDDDDDNNNNILHDHADQGMKL